MYVPNPLGRPHSLNNSRIVPSISFTASSYARVVLGGDHVLNVLAVDDERVLKWSARRASASSIHKLPVQPPSPAASHAAAVSPSQSNTRTSSDHP